MSIEQRPTLQPMTFQIGDVESVWPYSIDGLLSTLKLFDRLGITMMPGWDSNRRDFDRPIDRSLEHQKFLYRKPHRPIPEVTVPEHSVQVPRPRWTKTSSNEGRFQTRMPEAIDLPRPSATNLISPAGPTVAIKTWCRNTQLVHVLSPLCRWSAQPRRMTSSSQMQGQISLSCSPHPRSSACFLRSRSSKVCSGRTTSSESRAFTAKRVVTLHPWNACHEPYHRQDRRFAQPPATSSKFVIMLWQMLHAA